ncbi:MAG: SBBP repeat-containing protein, partial [Cyclobacteriaceae bacterium]|nr:SBBP repeat-containing protein [Cyclobacteriaceae bacterium]
MKKITHTILTFVISLASMSLMAQNPSFHWANTMGSTTADAGESITTDAAGNVLATGYFTQTVDFDPGTGSANLSSPYGNGGYIQKLDASNNLVWAKVLYPTSGSYCMPLEITSDASSNVYVTGYFSGSVDFNPGTGTSTLTSAGGTDIFIVKLNSSGTFVWAKRMGAASDDIGYGIAVDASGNVFTTGSFRNTADFDPGAGTVNLSSNGLDDIFIQKLNSSGTYQWAYSWGSTGADEGRSLAIYSSGNIAIVGNFIGTVDFATTSGFLNKTSSGNSDVFVHYLDGSTGAAFTPDIYGGTLNDYAY